MHEILQYLTAQHLLEYSSAVLSVGISFPAKVYFLGW